MDVSFDKEIIRFYLSFNDPASFILAPMVKNLSHAYKVDVEYIPVTTFDRTGLFSINEAERRYYIRDIGRFSKKADRKLNYIDQPLDCRKACLGRFYADEKMLGLKYINLVMAARWLGAKDISNTGAIAESVKFIELGGTGLAMALETSLYETAQAEAEAGAVKDGVIGVPFMVFRGEGFFGADRLPYLEDVIKSDPSLIVHHDASYSVISPGEMAEKVKNNEPLLALDVRIPKDFGQGHIPGANCLPAKIVYRNMNRLDRDWTIIVVDEGGVEASEVAFALAGAGFGKVAVLSGGMKLWNGAVETGLDKWQDKLKTVK
ncbi:MAG: DsbA family protein [Nitrospinae bacterium]|nr:DsbA family protein [Nitrospinota bacterium]